MKSSNKHTVVELSEQRGYGKMEEFPSKLPQCTDIYDKILVPRQGEQSFCLSFLIKEGKLSYQTSYFIGLDWIETGKLAAYVKPKMDNDECQIDYMSMLYEIIGNPKCHQHLKDLVHIKFDKPYIEIETKDDGLSPFIIIQFITLLRKLVQKGLKKSYYTVEENLNSRIKGKILIGKDVKTNQMKGKAANTYCRYQYFGYNSEENRILKKAFDYARTAIKHNQLYHSLLSEAICFIKPTFESVTDEIDITRIKHFTPNPLYPEYNECLRLALLLIKRYNYSIATAYKGESKVVATPPYWIDMSKLFELYVYHKLCDAFPDADIQYHKKVNRQEPDILFKGPDDSKYVIDAKYKPKYEEGHILKDDARQICGYTRMRKVYEILGVATDKVIPAVIIYPTFNGHDLQRKTFKKRNLVADDWYIELYKYSIILPTHEPLQ
jgi:5-methylcytosine-specific restriction enzyme subunit McrC